MPPLDKNSSLKDFRLLTMLLLGLAPFAYSQELAKQSNFEIEKIGGGELYQNKIHRRNASIYISNKNDRIKEDLIEALKSARAFDIIYVDDSAIIDLSEIWDLEVKEKVTLASGRGNNGSLGALLYTTTKENNELLHLKSGSRVTGLRLKGPTIIKDGPGMCNNDAEGIWISDSQGVEVDNNEIYAWPRAGAEVEGSQDIKIHHNHFHHHLRVERSSNCRNYALGYGVVADTSQDVIIERNLFDHNRHDIASSGSITADTEYFAYYNLVLGGAIGHNFDVHGGGDRSNRKDYNAGSYFEIKHNVFTQKDHHSVGIRGIPLVEAHVTNNEFPHSRESSAVFQKKCSEGEMQGCKVYKNMVVNNNKFNVNYPKRWFVSFSGETFWRFRKFDPSHPKHVRWGDFNGDGKQDAFRTENRQWQVSLSGLENWKKWNVSDVMLRNLGFADFNGDGKTDVFRTTGKVWYVSLGGSEQWRRWNHSAIALSDIKFGDFDGDGKDDVFWGNGSSWFVSHSGTGKWQRINTSSVKTSEVYIEDFDGDGRADVFRSSQGKWQVSLSGKSKWNDWNSSNISMSTLLFADLNGDGITDVFRGNGRRWYVSYSGKSNWQPLKHSTIKSKNLVLSDVNGDGKADVISHQKW